MKPRFQEITFKTKMSDEQIERMIIKIFTNQLKMDGFAHRIPELIHWVESEEGKQHMKENVMLYKGHVAIKGDFKTFKAALVVQLKHEYSEEKLREVMEIDHQNLINLHKISMN